jgi:hypothetical protein
VHIPLIPARGGNTSVGEGRDRGKVRYSYSKRDRKEQGNLNTFPISWEGNATHECAEERMEQKAKAKDESTS